MIRFITHRRFNYIDATGLVLVAWAFQDRNWIALVGFAVAFPLASVLAERAQGDRNE